MMRRVTVGSRVVHSCVLLMIFQECWGNGWRLVRRAQSRRPDTGLDRCQGDLRWPGERCKPGSAVLEEALRRPAVMGANTG